MGLRFYHLSVIKLSIDVGDHLVFSSVIIGDLSKIHPDYLAKDVILVFVLPLWISTTSTYNYNEAVSKKFTRPSPSHFSTYCALKTCDHLL